MYTLYLVLYSASVTVLETVPPVYMVTGSRTVRLQTLVVVSRLLRVCEMLASHKGIAEDSSLLGCDTVSFGEHLRFVGSYCLHFRA